MNTFTKNNISMTISNAVTGASLGLMTMLVIGSLLSLSTHPHWFIRGWDFPRLQIVVISWLILVLYFTCRYLTGDTAVVPLWSLLIMAVAITGWHGFRILPYTRLLPTQAAATSAEQRQSHRDDDHTLRIVLTNVETENDQYALWMQTMRAVDPDVILAVEIDDEWVAAVTELTDGYPHRIVCPQDNWYGMMLLSRFPFVQQQVRYLIEDDVPSVDVKLQLNNDAVIRLAGVHPRPPEPIRDNDAKARDAELALWAKELADEEGPVIIGGDLNDVAWSATTRLFLRVSGLLDPRRGRGFYNTFHAGHWFMRFPLDHIFHSTHFTVSQVKRLPFVGSDHFPILIDLRYAPEKAADHDVLDEDDSDQTEIAKRLDRAVKDKKLQGDATDEGKREAIKDVDRSS